MPDDQSGDAFDQALTADPATRHRDAFDQALAADPATRHRSVSPAAPQDALVAASGDAGAATPPPAPQAVPPPSQAQQSPPPAGGTAIASTASRFLGANAATIAPFLRQTGQSLDPTRANWCGAFVDGVLRANGVDGPQGPGKYVATSFLNWGEPAQGDPQPGDVLVQPRGHPAGGVGGHVGIATGQIADAPGGQTYYLMQSGNLNGRVAYSWEPAQSVVVRRAPQMSRQAQQ
jgi:hypothetical protein